MPLPPPLIELCVVTAAAAAAAAACAAVIMLSTENAFEHVFEDEDGLSVEDVRGGGRGGDGGRWEDVELAELEVEVPLLREEEEDGVTATPVGTLASPAAGGEAASTGVALALLSGAAAVVK